MEEEANQPKLYSPLHTVLITIGIYFAAQVVASTLISILPLVKHWSSAQTSDWLQNNVWATFAFVATIEATTILLIRFFLKRRKAGFLDIGLNKPRAKYIIYALAGFGAYFVLYILGLVVAKALVPGLDLEQKQELGFNTATTQGSALILVFISLVILPPIVEEIVVRGFLFGGLRTKLPFVSAAAITSVLFASAHLGEASDGLLWVAALDTFILSFVLCYLREKTDSLWPSIGVHMLKNGLAFILVFNIAQHFR